jgi:predicted ArsR family transcriptional regulator
VTLALRRDGPATVQDLADGLGLLPAHVRTALGVLAQSGAVHTDPLTAEGWRAQFWRVAE